MKIEVIAQVVGLVGLVCSLLSFQQKKRSGIMIFQMVASFLFALQLLMLGALTGACVDFISFIRTLIFSRNNKSKWASSPLWLVFFAAAMIVAGILTWDNIYSLLAIAGSLLSTVALWMKDGKKVRFVSLFVGPCWLVYNIVNGAYTGALNEVIAMASIVIGMIRHDRKKNVEGGKEDDISTAEA